MSEKPMSSERLKEIEKHLGIQDLCMECFRFVGGCPACRERRVAQELLAEVRRQAAEIERLREGIGQIKAAVQDAGGRNFVLLGALVLPQLLARLGAVLQELEGEK